MHVIKSVGVISVAKILGLIYGCMGLIFVPIFLIIGFVGAMAGPKAFPFGGVLGIVMAFALPILYGGTGFIMGTIGALLYNLFADWVGGFQVQLELARPLPPVAPTASYPPATP